MDTSIVHDFEKLLSSVGDNLTPDLCRNASIAIGEPTSPLQQQQQHRVHHRAQHYSAHQSPPPTFAPPSSGVNATAQLNNGGLKRRRYKKRRNRRPLLEDVLLHNRNDVTDSDYDVSNFHPNNSNFHHYKIDDAKNMTSVDDETMESGANSTSRNVKRKRRLKHRLDGDDDGAVSREDDINMKSCDHSSASTSNKMDGDFSSMSSGLSSDSSDSSEENTELQAGDGDDEYSDTTASVSTNGIITWWENDENNEPDSRLKNIMNNVFDNLPESSKSQFSTTINYLEGCHRNRMKKYKDQVKMRSIEDIDTVKIKRRKRQCNEETVAAPSMPIPEDNIGCRMLRDMGWGGEGLGVKGDGIKTPILPTFRKGRKGLGNDM